MSLYFQFPSIDDYPISANPFKNDDEIYLNLLDKQLVAELEALKKYLELGKI